ncbi:uncharacterized protein FFB20_03414 [Fusarium fujikuroi]|nr:uncharacterized protein FFB20_03414 [Fusarium fujikuroi]SCO11753.1 uncharacterized protein FFE2_12417 [Fusarium fujikuroi]SCO20200.1 uncharacterized protein FFM5_12309 [Fusarium fujikuroi]SCO23056.1 uncharacterized protein FFC1_14625 [Fusarium fujikuroi]SCO50528.1 uncharacterized protein FFNC_13104 [Fusarium fujikuroi]
MPTAYRELALEHILVTKFDSSIYTNIDYYYSTFAPLLLPNPKCIF